MHKYTLHNWKPNNSIVFIALSAICLPFVTPALRRVCLPYVPATTTQLENIQSALKYHGSKPGTKSKLVDIGNFLSFHILWEEVTTCETSNKNSAVICFFPTGIHR